MSFSNREGDCFKYWLLITRVISYLGGLDTGGSFSAIFHKGDNFYTSYLLSSTLGSLWKGPYSKRKEFASYGGKVFPFGEDSFSEGDKINFDTVTSLNAYPFPLNTEWRMI